MSKQALQGGAYMAHSVIASAQRCVNLVQEPMPEAQGEPMPSAAYPTPGTRWLGSVGNGPIRGIRQATTGAIYVVSGSGVYVVDPTTVDGWYGTHLGDITAGLKTPVSMADNGLDMVIVDGTANGWHITLVGNVFSPIVQSATLTPFVGSGGTAILAGTAYYTPFTPTFDGFLTSATVSLLNGYTGHMKCSVFYNHISGLPSEVLGSAKTLTNPATGVNQILFATPLALTGGTKYWIAFDSDASFGTWDLGDGGTGLTSTTPYASFPVVSPNAILAQAPIVTLTLETDPGSVFVGADRVDYLDTYLLFNKPNTPQFYSSDSLALTFDPLWFANKESYSDLLQTLVVAKRNIWLFGAVSTEVWANVGKPDFPFESQGDVFIDHGVVAKYSVAEYDNGVFWLSRDRQGQGIVIMGAGYQTKRTSTYAIEAEIAGYERISDAIGFCYQLAGHSFYVLIFPHADKTWSYDITTGLWHEWVWIDANGDEHRHRSNCFWPINGTPVVGDWQNGNLYALDQRVFTDNGHPIKRVRSYPHIVADGKRVFYRQFVADMDTGNPSSPAEVITSTETIITWLPNIARFNGVSVGSLAGVFIDWPRGLVYMVGDTGYQKYTTAMETQTALATVAVPSRFALAGGLDPLSGCLLLQTSTTISNGLPISKVDPNTFATLGTFGGASISPSYPTSVWAGQSIVCVVCNGVSFGFLKESPLSGYVAGFRVDTMAHSGFYANIVSGSTNNRGGMIAGKSGGSSASVFLSWDATTTIAPSVPLYRIDVAASATAYNPATWPATNPGITWTTVGSIPVAAVDPAWTGFTVYSMGYDLADGNVIMAVGTQTSAQGYRVLKLNATTAAVMWNIAIGTAAVNLGGSRINGSLWMIRNPGAGAGPTSSYRINTLTGTMETLPITGFFASSGALAQQTDSETSLMFYGGTFNSQTGAANPVEGTSTFSNAWAFMGGQTIRTNVTAGQTWGNLISLRWSDDRAHSWGSPVTQSIGAAGEYRTSLQWQRLGMSRDRVFEISWSVPTATALQGCWFDATPAQS